MNEQASSGRAPADGTVPAVEEMEFAEFLESVPPSQRRSIKNLGTLKNSYVELHTPQLLLHCTSEMCNGPRAHRRTEDTPALKAGEATNVYVATSARTAEPDRNCILSM
jgi:hypothetical protein